MIATPPEFATGRPRRVLVVAHRGGTEASVSEALESLGCSVSWAESGGTAAELLRSERFNVALCDVRVGDEAGVDLLQILFAHDRELRVAVMTERPDCAGAVDAIQRGAVDYVPTPLTVELLRPLLEARAAQVAPVRDARALPVTWATPCDALGLAERAATGTRPVLLAGEHGTSKRHLARFIHERSGRVGPFVPVDGRVHRTLLADPFDEARDGTLFVNEISELTNAQQEELFALVQDGSTAGVSSGRSAPPRVIAASSRNVLEDVATGRLRRDLIDTFVSPTINVRPLRRRPDEIVSLANALVAEWPGTRPNAASIALEAQEILLAWPWPENISELVNVFALMKPAPIVTGRALLEAIASCPRHREREATLSPEEMERERAVWALARSRSLNQASRTLQIQARTLRKKLRIWGRGETSRLPRHATTRWC